MRINKKNPRKQLEKYSGIFLQLGLVLTLFIVFIAIEHKTERKKVAFYDSNPEPENVYTLEENHSVIYTKDVPKSKPQAKKEILQLTKIDPVVNTDITNTVVLKPTDEPVSVPLDITKVKEVAIDDIDTDDDPKNILNVQKIPVIHGCENLSKNETLKCLDTKIKRVVLRNFDASIAEDLGLKSGKHRIYAQFIIDKLGYVTNIKVNAPHPKLKKEAEKVVHKIPNFTPGEVNGKKVKVKYTLPITFHVE